MDVALDLPESAMNTSGGLRSGFFILTETNAIMEITLRKLGSFQRHPLEKQTNKQKISSSWETVTESYAE